MAVTRRIMEGLKPDVAREEDELTGGATENTDFFHLRKSRRAMFYVVIGSELEDDESVRLTARQATDSDGSDADDIEDRDGDEVRVNVDAPDNGSVPDAHVVEIDVTGVADGDEITINDVEFEGALASDYDEQEFDTSGADTATATDLAACINANFDDIEASAVGTDVTVEAVDPGETLVTVEDAHANYDVETHLATAIIEVTADQLDAGFEWVGLEILSDRNDPDPDVTVFILRGDARYTPEQKVAASN